MCSVASPTRGRNFCSCRRAHACDPEGLLLLRPPFVLHPPPLRSTGARTAPERKRERRRRHTSSVFLARSVRARRPLDCVRVFLCACSAATGFFSVSPTVAFHLPRLAIAPLPRRGACVCVCVKETPLAVRVPHRRRSPLRLRPAGRFGEALAALIDLFFSSYGLLPSVCVYIQLVAAFRNSVRNCRFERVWRPSLRRRRVYVCTHTQHRTVTKAPSHLARGEGAVAAFARAAAGFAARECVRRCSQLCGRCCSLSLRGGGKDGSPAAASTGVGLCRPEATRKCCAKTLPSSWSTLFHRPRSFPSAAGLCGSLRKAPRSRLYRFARGPARARGNLVCACFL